MVCGSPGAAQACPDRWHLGSGQQMKSLFIGSIKTCCCLPVTCAPGSLVPGCKLASTLSDLTAVNPCTLRCAAKIKNHFFFSLLCRCCRSDTGMSLCISVTARGREESSEPRARRFSCWDFTQAAPARVLLPEQGWHRDGPGQGSRWRCGAGGEGGRDGAGVGAAEGGEGCAWCRPCPPVQGTECGRAQGRAKSVGTGSPAWGRAGQRAELAPPLRWVQHGGDVPGAEHQQGLSPG